MRPQADALGQNLPHRAISSAVEHLPYKEIVTGSIPVSPISKPCAALGFVGFFASARQRSFSSAIACWLGAEFTAQDAFCPSHHFEAGLPVSSGVGSVHAFHVLLLWGHKPFAVGRSIDPIRLACRSCNYSSAWRRDRQVCKGGATPKSLAEGPLRENR